MNLNREVQPVLQAQYDFEAAYPNEKAARLAILRKAFQELLLKVNEEARSRKLPTISEAELLEALGARYQEFKKQRDLEARNLMRRIL
jgi:hypothetical protein